MQLACFPAAVCAGELWPAVEHSLRHRETVPCICAFSVAGYVTVCLILLIIKSFGATSAEIVKSMRKVRGEGGLWGEGRCVPFCACSAWCFVA